MKILHLDSSIQGDNSASRALSAAVVDRLRSDQPEAEVVYRDLALRPIEHLTLDQFGTDEAQQVMADFLTADVVVIGTALYNFTIASRLKAWIDRVPIAGQTFQYGANGPEGLAGGKRVIVTLARGGVYSGESPFAPFEHAETLLRGVLAFIGITDPEFIIAEGLAISPEARQASIDTALEQARGIAPGQLAA